MTLGSAAQIKAIITELDGVTEKLIVSLTTNINANLVRATPVDTGWARANWMPSIGQPSDAQDGGGSSRTINGYKLSQGKVHLTNNVPYIGRLNDGSSNQAPAGFVQRAIADGVSQVRT